MADDLEKFVLQYSVDMKDAIGRLEKLNQTVEKTNKNANKASKEFKHFASGAAVELDKLVPGMSKITTGIRAMSSEFAAAAIGVGILGAAIGALMKTREDYNRQRKEGMDIGVSSTRIEDYQRKFATQSKGQISREKTLEQLRKVQEFGYQAYTDPIQFNQQAKTLQMLGISPGIRGQGATNVADLMQQLGRSLSKMSDESARGIGKTMGLDQDFVRTLRNMGGGVNDVGMSYNEVMQRQADEQGLDKFNTEMASAEEAFTRLAHIIGSDLLPGFTEFVEWVGRLAGDTKGMADRKAAAEKQQFVFNRRDELQRQYNKQHPEGAVSSGWDALSALWRGRSNKEQRDLQFSQQAEKEWDDKHSAPASDKPTTQKDVNKVVEGMDKNNRTALDTASNMQLAVNMFAQSVATFANALDERTAWAAWAGALGKANGLQGPGSGIYNGNPSTAGLPTQYDEIFNSAGKRWGVDPVILKNIARVESSFRADADSGKAAGLMGINYDNFKAYDVTNWRDPGQSINAGAHIFSEYLRASNGDLSQALMMYHAGPDRKGWGPLTKAYPGKVLGGATQGIGQTDLQKVMVQRNIAAALGMPVSQLQRGGATRGDVEFTTSQFAGSLQNNIFSLNKQLAQTGLRQADRSKLMTELRDTERGLSLVRSYGAGLASNSRDTDERPITQGARPVIININGGTYDPKVLANIISGHLAEQFGDVANSSTTAVKR